MLLSCVTPFSFAHAHRCVIRRDAVRGFTMVELITVIVLIGILGAIGAGRFFDSKPFDALEFADQTKAMLRYGQKVAIAQNRPVYVRLVNNSIALCFDAACSSYVIPASGANSGSTATLAACSAQTKWYCESAPRNMSYALAPALTLNNYFYFNALGKPYAAIDTVGQLNSTFSRLVMTISGDNVARTVTIEPETGYVY